ncbi:MAG: hypothetical protein EXR95_02575 [Gemmatimonadetes bacterium]|nr:hypothetical protein [Gemmatimonadota bacterium]
MNASDAGLQALRYPIGRASFKAGLTAAERAPLIERIAAVPLSLREALAGLPERGLDTPYRPGGWTVRQVVHHLPDSHMNAYVRFARRTPDRPDIPRTEKPPERSPLRGFFLLPAPDGSATASSTRRTPPPPSCRLRSGHARSASSALPTLRRARRT